MVDVKCYLSILLRLVLYLPCISLLRLSYILALAYVMLVRCLNFKSKQISLEQYQNKQDEEERGPMEERE